MDSITTDHPRSPLTKKLGKSRKNGGKPSWRESMKPTQIANDTTTSTMSPSIPPIVTSTPPESSPRTPLDEIATPVILNLLGKRIVVDGDRTSSSDISSPEAATPLASRLNNTTVSSSQVLYPPSLEVPEIDMYPLGAQDQHNSNNGKHAPARSVIYALTPTSASQKSAGHTRVFNSNSVDNMASSPPTDSPTFMSPILTASTAASPADSPSTSISSPPLPTILDSSSATMTAQSLRKDILITTQQNTPPRTNTTPSASTLLVRADVVVNQQQRQSVRGSSSDLRSGRAPSRSQISAQAIYNSLSLSLEQTSAFYGARATGPASPTLFVSSAARAISSPPASAMPNQSSSQQQLHTSSPSDSSVAHSLQQYQPYPTTSVNMSAAATTKSPNALSSTDARGNMSPNKHGFNPSAQISPVKNTARFRADSRSSESLSDTMSEHSGSSFLPPTLPRSLSAESATFKGSNTEQSTPSPSSENSPGTFGFGSVSSPPRVATQNTVATESQLHRQHPAVTGSVAVSPALHTTTSPTPFVPETAATFLGASRAVASDSGVSARRSSVSMSDVSTGRSPSYLPSNPPQTRAFILNTMAQSPPFGPSSTVNGVTTLSIKNELTDLNSSRVVETVAASVPTASEPVARCGKCGLGCVYCSSEVSAKSRKKWKKVLYEKQDYDDNYTDESFLSSLVTNAHVQRPNFWGIVSDTTVVTQLVSALAIFMCVFAFLYDSVNTHFTVEHLIAVDLLGMAIGGAIMVTLDSKRDFSVPLALTKLSSYIKNFVMRGILFIWALLMFSPVLKTLTLSYSSDTIWALTITLSAVHLVFFEYRYIACAAIEDNIDTDSPDQVLASLTQSNGPLSPSGADLISPNLRARKNRMRFPGSKDRVPSVSFSSSGGTNGSAGDRTFSMFRNRHRRENSSDGSQGQDKAVKVSRRYIPRSATTFQGTISLNAALFAAVLLASRLNNLPPPSSLLSVWQIPPGGFSGPRSLLQHALSLASSALSEPGTADTLAAFALVFFAFEVFAGFPIIAHQIRRYSFEAHFWTTVALFLLTCILLLLKSLLIALLYVLSIGFVTFGCPALLLYIQRFKNEIQGPWDYDDNEEGLG